jgi:AcrR family transcriptional regulator
MERKQLIINTATRLFVELGFHGTATSKIAQESGVANGTLFNYFKTKDELVFSLYHTILVEMDDYIIEQMKSYSITKESFQSLFVATLMWSLENHSQYQYLQQFKHSPYFHQLECRISDQEDPLYKLLQNGIDLVLLKPMPAPLMFSLWKAQIGGLHNYLIANDFTKEAQLVLIQDAFEMLWKMIVD